MFDALFYSESSFKVYDGCFHLSGSTYITPAPLNLNTQRRRRSKDTPINYSNTIVQNSVSSHPRPQVRHKRVFKVVVGRILRGAALRLLHRHNRSAWARRQLEGHHELGSAALDGRIHAELHLTLVAKRRLPHLRQGSAALTHRHFGLELQFKRLVRLAVASLGEQALKLIDRGCHSRRLGRITSRHGGRGVFGLAKLHGRSFDRRFLGHEGGLLTCSFLRRDDESIFSHRALPQRVSHNTSTHIVFAIHREVECRLGRSRASHLAGGGHSGGRILAFRRLHTSLHLLRLGRFGVRSGRSKRIGFLLALLRRDRAGKRLRSTNWNEGFCCREAKLERACVHFVHIKDRQGRELGRELILPESSRRTAQRSTPGTIQHFLRILLCRLKHLRGNRRKGGTKGAPPSRVQRFLFVDRVQIVRLDISRKILRFQSRITIIRIRTVQWSHELWCFGTRLVVLGELGLRCKGLRRGFPQRAVALGRALGAGGFERALRRVHVTSSHPARSRDSRHFGNNAGRGLVLINHRSGNLGSRRDDQRCSGYLGFPILQKCLERIHLLVFHLAIVDIFAAELALPQMEDLHEGFTVCPHRERVPSQGFDNGYRIPCIFPVLGVHLYRFKLRLGHVENAGHKRERIRRLHRSHRARKRLTIRNLLSQINRGPQPTNGTQAPLLVLRDFKRGWLRGFPTDSRNLQNGRALRDVFFLRAVRRRGGFCLDLVEVNLLAREAVTLKHRRRQH
mmetsp:Transcript_7713/g.19080  ORF Transcript_7713/g.19080 Transcript_7713/m.19080 type:complete len:735 (-) Transcript_7713:166-2370(-)